MSFTDMPDLGPFLRPDARQYAEDCLRLSRVAVDRTKTVLDVPYGAEFFQKLDIFLPDTVPPDVTVPVLLFLHGGAWKNGFKEWMGFMAPPLLDVPSIFISANYRLAPAVKFPVLLDDCCDALAWIWRHIAGYGGDRQRLYVGGHSAGGHLAALMSLRPDCLTGRGMPADTIKGCFALSAAFNLERKGANAERAQLLDLLLEPGDDGAAVSPLNYVAGTRVPFHITYGTHDLPELLADNERMIELLGREDCLLEHHCLEGQSHFDTNLSCADPQSVWVRSVRRRLGASASAPA